MWIPGAISQQAMLALRSDYFEVEYDGFGEEGRVIRAGQ